MLFARAPVVKIWEGAERRDLSAHAVGRRKAGVVVVAARDTWEHREVVSVEQQRVHAHGQQDGILGLLFLNI